MLWSNKKGEEGSSWGLIFAIVLGMVFLAMFIGIILVLKGDFLTKETALQTGCWLTNSIKCEGGLFSIMPSLCSPLETLEEPITEEKFASLLRDSYWMFKQGECDFQINEDVVYPVYAFKLTKNVDLNEFIVSLTQRKDGEIKKNLDISKSDYAYLEEGTYYQTLCFDTNDKLGIGNMLLLKDKWYYILYYDDSSQFVAGVLSSREKSDAILISDDPTFDKGAFENFLATNTPLAANVIGAFIANSILETTDEERGCLVYGANPNEE